MGWAKKQVKPRRCQWCGTVLQVDADGIKKHAQQCSKKGAHK